MCRTFSACCVMMNIPGVHNHPGLLLCAILSGLILKNVLKNYPLLKAGQEAGVPEPFHLKITRYLKQAKRQVYRSHFNYAISEVEIFVICCYQIS
jgi:hypothetical protein